MKNLFKQNTGLLDRALRLFVGIALVTWATIVANDTVRVVFIILSIPLFFSGITGFCPTYTLFGISTASPRNQTVAQTQHGCCSTGQKMPSCASMMKEGMDFLNDRPWGTSKAAISEPEGRKR